MLPLVYRGVRVSRIYIYIPSYRRKREERNYVLGMGSDGKLSVSSGEEKVWTISFIRREEE